MITKNVTTIELDGNETAVEFAESYPYFWITNKGSADIYVSPSAGIVPKADGVYTIAAGSSERIGSGYRNTKFYILGTGEAYIRGEKIASQPSFKKGGEGGERGGIISEGYDAMLSEPSETLASDAIYEI